MAPAQEDLKQALKLGLDTFAAEFKLSISASFAQLEQKLVGIWANYEERLAKVESELELLYKKSNEKVVVVIGIPEKAGETAENLEEEINELFQDIEYHEVVISKCRRLGIQKQHKTRPVEVHLHEVEEKWKILENKKKLANSKKWKHLTVQPARSVREILARKKLVELGKEEKKGREKLKFYIRNGIMHMEDNGVVKRYEYRHWKDKVEELQEDEAVKEPKIAETVGEREKKLASRKKKSK